MLGRLAAALCCALLLAAAVPAETFRVDNVNGDDAAGGVQAPLKTLAAATSLLKPGDTLLLVKTAQPYRESLVLRSSGTPLAPITIDGGGATITGADSAPEAGWQHEGDTWSLPQATEVKFLFGPDCRYEQGRSPTELKPREWFWKQGTLFFRPEAGKTPADYGLQLSVRISGVVATGQGQILVRNLTAINFYNDGFNIHNGSAPLWFENIRGLWNGDEGFSAHENCECYVRGGEFSHNYWHGINDIGIARTFFQNVTCCDNRSKGVWFIGGMHSLTDCEISGSPAQLVLSASDLEVYPQQERLPHRISRTNIRNVHLVSVPGQNGLVVNSGAEGVVEHTLIEGGETCLQVAEKSTAYVLNSIIAGGVKQEVNAVGTYAAEANLYYPGRLTVAGVSYTPEQFAAYQEASGNDRSSLLEEPRLIAGTSFASIAGHAYGSALNLWGFGGPDIGIDARGLRPAEPGVRAAPPAPSALAPLGGTVRSAAEATSVLFDFEKVNTWSRIYPGPEQNQAGEKVKGTSELSGEQAHSGARAAKITLTIPPAPPADNVIRLFTEKLPLSRPVLAWRFWLYGDNSGRTVTMRVRDASGECFYGTPQKLDFSGWRQFSWDLRQAPAANIISGDGNKQQDGPPLELVLEIAATAGSTVTLYVDDLEVDLAP